MYTYRSSFLLVASCVIFVAHGKPQNPYVRPAPPQPGPNSHDNPQILPVPVGDPQPQPQPPQHVTRDVVGTGHPQSPAEFHEQYPPSNFGSSSTSTQGPYLDHPGQGQGSGSGDDRVLNEPKFCTKEYDPVCGSNNRTYSNGCMLNQDRKFDSSLTIAKHGECGTT